MPLPRPKPVKLEAVNVPVLLAVSPVSSTFTVSVLPPPFTVTKPTRLFTVPPVAEAKLPKLKVSLPNPPLRFSAPVLDCTLNVSAPSLPLTVVTAVGVLTIKIVSPPLPSEIFSTDKPL